MTAQKFLLPHGASGIDIGDFVISFGNGKIIVLAKQSGLHYTMQAGHVSGILDIHRTWRNPDGTERHQTVFAMHRADLQDLLATLSSMTTDVFRLLRRLRLGWLYRNDIGIVGGLDPITDQEIAAVTRRRRGKKLVVDESKLHENVKVPEYLEDIWGLPDGAFSVMSRGRKIGIAIKVTDPNGYPHLYWFRFRDISRFFQACQDRFLAAALKYAIPRERYKDYGVLEP